MNALPNYAPTPEIGPPIVTLRGALAQAARRYPAPYVAKLREKDAAIFGNEFGDYIAFRAVGTLYRHEPGQPTRAYSVKEVHSIVRDYIAAHRGMPLEINPIDALCWYAECTLANAPPIELTPEPHANHCKALMTWRDTRRQNILHRWAQMCAQRRPQTTEATPDRLSDDPKTPAPPVLAPCPFVKAG